MYKWGLYKLHVLKLASNHPEDKSILVHLYTADNFTDPKYNIPQALLEVLLAYFCLQSNSVLFLLPFCISSKSVFLTTRIVLSIQDEAAVWIYAQHYFVLYSSPQHPYPSIVLVGCVCGFVLFNCMVWMVCMEFSILNPKYEHP